MTSPRVWYETGLTGNHIVAESYPDSEPDVLLSIPDNSLLFRRGAEWDHDMLRAVIACLTQELRVPAPPPRFSGFAFTCETCGRRAFAESAYLATARAESGGTVSDARLAEDLQVCISCAWGSEVEGEHVTPTFVRVSRLDAETDTETVETERANLADVEPDPRDRNMIARDLYTTGDAIVGGGAAPIFRLVTVQ